MPKLNKDALDAIKDQSVTPRCYISVGMSACGIAAGAEVIFNILEAELKKRKLDIELQKCGCIGKCFAEPLVEVKVEGLPTVIYGKVTVERALEILEKHVAGKMLLNDCIYGVK